MKKLLILALAATLALSMMACTNQPTTPNTDTPATDAQGNPVETLPGGNTQDPGNNQNPGTTAPTTVVLTFNGTQLNTSVQDTGIQVEGGAFVITRGGSYEFRGDLSGGQIKVAVPKTEQVELIFNNFTASCNNSAPLYIESADKATIVLAAGSVNTLTDATLYQFANPAEDKPNACIYSSDDLTIKGTGTLNVNGNYNNGIGCKNDLSINNCKLTVSGVNNAIKGNGSVTIKGDADVLVEGAEDAVKTDSLDVGKGFLLITENAKVTVNCTDDGLQATQDITLTTGATVTTYAGGNAVNCDGTVNIDEGTLTENTPEV